jgi:hypothetical protein
MIDVIPSKMSGKLLITVIIIAASILPATAIAGGVFDTYSSSSTPCCPNFYIQPLYDYYGNQIWPPEGESFDPYYMFPLYCSCPFLDNMLNRSWYHYYGPSIIINTSSPSSCSSCYGSESSAGQSISYMSDNIDVPDKATIIASKSKSGNTKPLYSKTVMYY